ncbi:MAG TPA: 4-hydroxy-3-methylbut-2-enyl diphosphate reductase [bacterium]|jgi:(E)-4-hydroxy-3-methyl-but-2-enyl pyrophosphate reductase|nr:4-hydroxy-3-methylbut-2-enyl diphosphate reductase [bacterium]
MPREIQIANAAGFCFGVKKAIQKAETMDRAFIFGSLIHNPQEVARLASLNKKIVHSLEDVEDNRVVITAHGLDINVIGQMKERNLEIIDTTCPLVTKIYNEGHKLEAQGLQIVIIGDPKHVEVKGIASRMKNPLIVYHEEDIQAVPEGSKVGVVCQSTLLMEKFDKFVALLRARCAEVVTVNTICKPTKDRQTAAAALSKTMDIMIVIGGRNSSNTHKLADTCKMNLPHDTYHVETAQELEPKWFEGKNKVGITAGASTPDYLIEEVITKIRTYDSKVTAST